MASTNEKKLKLKKTLSLSDILENLNNFSDINYKSKERKKMIM